MNVTSVSIAIVFPLKNGARTVSMINQCGKTPLDKLRNPDATSGRIRKREEAAVEFGPTASSWVHLEAYRNFRKLL